MVFGYLRYDAPTITCRRAPGSGFATNCKKPCSGGKLARINGEFDSEFFAAAGAARGAAAGPAMRDKNILDPSMFNVALQHKDYATIFYKFRGSI